METMHLHVPSLEKHSRSNSSSNSSRNSSSNSKNSKRYQNTHSPAGEEVEDALHEVGVGVVGLAQRGAAVDEHEGHAAQRLHALDQVQQHAAVVHVLRALQHIVIINNRAIQKKIDLRDEKDQKLE